MSPSCPQAVDPVQTEIGRLLDYSVVSTLTTQRINRCLSPSQEEIKTQGSPLPPSPSPGGGLSFSVRLWRIYLHAVCMAIVCWLEAGILGGISIWVVRNELAEGRIERRDGEKRRKNVIFGESMQMWKQNFLIRR